MGTYVYEVSEDGGPWTIATPSPWVIEALEPKVRISLELVNRNIEPEVVEWRKREVLSEGQSRSNTTGAL